MAPGSLEAGQGQRRGQSLAPDDFIFHQQEEPETRVPVHSGELRPSLDQETTSPRMPRFPAKALSWGGGVCADNSGDGSSLR